jgi:hypothetical protein
VLILKKNYLGSLFVRKLTMPNASTYVQVVDKSSGKYKGVKRFGMFKNESATWAQGIYAADSLATNARMVCF